MHRRTDRPRHQIAFVLILQVGWPLNAVMNDVYRNKMLMPGKVIHAQPSAKASVSIQLSSPCIIQIKQQQQQKAGA